MGWKYVYRNRVNVGTPDEFPKTVNALPPHSLSRPGPCPVKFSVVSRTAAHICRLGIVGAPRVETSGTPHEQSSSDVSQETFKAFKTVL